MGGLAILSLRIIAAIGGPISRLFGRFGAESFTQFVGWCILPLAIWVTINSILTSINVGLL
jgi:small neutral amino acid transporter SnatA (MarC family)